MVAFSCSTPLIVSDPVEELAGKFPVACLKDPLRVSVALPGADPPVSCPTEPATEIVAEPCVAALALA
jgi:hypothetical protein